MLGSITDQFRAAKVPLWGAFVALAIVACASSTTNPSSQQAQQLAIEDVIVESEAGISRVTLVGLDEPVFTAFQQADPDRVIVDLAGVDLGESADPVAVYDGTIDEISIAPFSTGSGESMTRVEVSLSGAADYDVWAENGSLIIEVASLGDMASLDVEEGDGTGNEDPWAVVPREGDEDAGTTGTSDHAEVVASPATTLVGIEARVVGEGLMIVLEGDGTVESVVTFTLENPSRLVLDLQGMSNSVETPRLEVDSTQVSQIRIGAHPDKVRIVVDGGSDGHSFDDRRVVPTASGLIIALGSGVDLDAAVAEASSVALQAMPVEELAEGSAIEISEEASEEIADEDGVMVASDGVEAETDIETDEPVEMEALVAEGDAPLVTIYGVEFDMQAERDRVVVLSEHPVDYLIYEPDAETIVVSIQGAIIDPEAAVRIAPDVAGPVSLVTAFEQPDVETPEVRIVVKRAPNLDPEVSRRGSLLLLDFPRSGGLATAPPILTTEGEIIVAVDGEAMVAESGEVAMSMAAEPMMEPVSELAALDQTLLDPAPASVAPAAAPIAVTDRAPELAPAAIDAPAAISILNEGGLMDGKEYVGRRISLDFKAVDIADVLRLIAEVSDLNVIAGDEVKGAVTIRLVEVPWDQALDVILLTKGLGFMRIGNVLRIAAADLLAQEEELRLQERRAKEKLEDLVVKLQPVNYADVGDVSKMISQLLTARGSVNTDTRTNTLIIKDIPSVIDEATALVKAVDTMTPQVMIEAKIVEAGLEFSREFGAVWSFGANPTNTTLGGRDFIPTSGGGIVPAGLANTAVFGNPITSSATGFLGLAGTVLDDRFNIEADIRAAEVNGDGKVISSPRIVTLDNSEATIEQGVSIPFQTFENGDAQLEFVDAVLKLKVTPHITSDRSIIMKIHVSRNAPDDSVFTLTGSPAIAKNQVKTETLVKDGQTLVLGGIYVVDRAQRQSRTPYLHKIPFIGMAFRSNEISDSRKELLIFVTPRIVRTGEAAS